VSNTARLRTALLATILPVALLVGCNDNDAEVEGATPPQEIGEPMSQERMQELLGEMQAIYGQLQPIQQQALAEPEFQERQQELNEDVMRAMHDADPEMETTMQRAEGLEQEAMAAQAEGDQERLQALSTEAQQIQRRMQQAQAAALEDDALSGRIEDFERDIRARMVEIDPEAEALMARADEIEAQLEASIPQTGPGF